MAEPLLDRKVTLQRISLSCQVGSDAEIPVFWCVYSKTAVLVVMSVLKDLEEGYYLVAQKEYHSFLAGLQGTLPCKVCSSIRVRSRICGQCQLIGLVGGRISFNQSQQNVAQNSDSKHDPLEHRYFKHRRNTFLRLKHEVTSGDRFAKFLGTNGKEKSEL